MPILMPQSPANYTIVLKTLKRLEDDYGGHRLGVKISGYQYRVAINMSYIGVLPMYKFVSPLPSTPPSGTYATSVFCKNSRTTWNNLVDHFIHLCHLIIKVKYH